jgi:hypothetical protein
MGRPKAAEWRRNFVRQDPASNPLPQASERLRPIRSLLAGFHDRIGARLTEGVAIKHHPLSVCSTQY